MAVAKGLHVFEVLDISVVSRVLAKLLVAVVWDAFVVTAMFALERISLAEEHVVAVLNAVTSVELTLSFVSDTAQESYL